MKKKIVFIFVSLLLAGVETSAQKNMVDEATVIAEFRQYVETLPYLADASIVDMSTRVEEHVKCLQNWTDKEAYLKEHDLVNFLNANRDSVNYYKGLAPGLTDGFLQQYKQRGIENESGCRDSLNNIIDEKLGSIEVSLNHLDHVINGEGLGKSSGLDWKWMALIVAALVLIGLLYALLRKRQAPEPTPVINKGQGTNNQNNQGTGIVVRRKTATILKKQSLENVIGNPAYLQVDATDFTYESAVRRIYIKNTCIVDIYNMYAEDLQKPENPKEDGCMVLGRWVYDSESQEYYVSLEQIVLPGDDAVFAEYELNFGGKIKLKVVELLRKLRRETNFQYDLTCWVHSHPGLGVFFSNSDVTVQMQLKHPSHPNFLTAIVVDILTPDMDLGIFTFKRDETINSRNDLKKMYSLKEWYEWAIENMNETDKDDSADNSKVIEENEFNTLAVAASHVDSCESIKLGREMIVDMCMSTSDDSNGIIGLVHGDSKQRGNKVTYHAKRLSNNETVDDMQLIGCFVADDHCSLPSIRKVVDNYLDKIQFVLVYKPSNGQLTSIPVIDKDLCTDESLYGEQSLDELKAWTRKKN
jgi:hypothetical protein